MAIKNILVTGGLGFIGSHAVSLLQEAGYRVTILDNLSNSRERVLDAITYITGVRPDFVRGDVRDVTTLKSLFVRERFWAVMHFAGLKAVGESTSKPLEYYDNNVAGTLRLLEAMRMTGNRTLIFSSSATVYGIPAYLPLDENHPRSTTNPYGHTKLVVEDILQSLFDSDPTWRIARLRYFNPIGAHPSGVIGENPNGVPNNLMPYIAQVAAGKRVRLGIFGSDYDTPDGTGVRDYIHVMDLAQGHLAALDYCVNHPPQLITANLGTGNGYSVLEMVHAFEEASGCKVPYEFKDRRIGDVDACWADTHRAEALFGWKATRSLYEMCTDAWRWELTLSKRR